MWIHVKLYLNAPNIFTEEFLSPELKYFSNMHWTYFMQTKLIDQFDQKKYVYSVS